MLGKKGFTLVELLVYIVIAAIVVGIAGQAFVDSARARMRTTRLLEASMGTTNVVDYLQEDIRRIGTKTWMRSSSSSAGSSSSEALLPRLAAVYWAPLASIPDSSSFLAESQGSGSHRLDRLEFRAGLYNSSGVIIGFEQIRYHVVDGVLWRTVVARKDADGNNLAIPDSVRMAEHVVAFKLRYGVSVKDSVVFSRELREPCVATSPESACLTQYGGSSASLGNYGGMPLVSGVPLGSMASFKLVKGSSPLVVDGFTVKPGFTYRVEFGLGSNDSAAAYFRSDSDFVAVAVAPAGSQGAYLAGTQNVLFYSALNTDLTDRSFDFTSNVSSSTSASLEFKFQLRNRSVAAPELTAMAFRMDSVVVREIGEDAYQWKDAFSSTSSDIRSKGRVRAVEMTISVQGNTAVSTATKVIPVLNNGV